MSSPSVWGNEAKTIIYRELGAIWTWDEYRANCEQEQEMAASVQHSVSLIIDATNSLTLPNGSVAHFKNTLENCCEQCEKLIIVSNSHTYWTIHRLLIQMLPKMQDHFFIVRTLEEAYKLAQDNTRKPLVR